MLKLDIETSVNLLQPLLTEIWKEEKFPADWKEGLIIKIPKKYMPRNANTGHCNLSKSATTSTN
jgi:hypothetical protein